MNAATRQLLAVATLFAAGCAAATSGAQSDRNRITAEQLASSTAQNAYEAIVRIQPQWLEGRGPTSVTEPNPTTPTVFLDGSRAGEVDFLRTIQVNTLAEIRYLPPGEASARYGMGFPRGVIELISVARR